MQHRKGFIFEDNENLKQLEELCSSSFDEEMLEKSQLKVANVHSMPLDVSCYKLTQKEVLGLVPLGISRKPKKNRKYFDMQIINGSQTRISGPTRENSAPMELGPPMELSRSCIPRSNSSKPSIQTSEGLLCNSMDPYASSRSKKYPECDLLPVRSRWVKKSRILSNKLKEREHTKSSGDKMMIIVSLQNFDGSWSPSSELESGLNITKKDMEAKYKGNIWCTALVVAFLEKNFSKRKSEWEMIYNKAIKWLTSQHREDKSVTQIIEEGNAIIKTI